MCSCRNMLLNVKKRKEEYDELMEKLQHEVSSTSLILCCTVHFVNTLDPLKVYETDISLICNIV